LDDRAFDREVHILRYVASPLCHIQGIELFNNHTHDIAGLIEQGTTAIPWLNGCGDLELAGVVTDACERTDVSGGDVQRRGEEPM
jgi:hypothetical protein